MILHLRPGAREWFHDWLRREHPQLLPLYERLYRHGAYAPKSYQREVLELIEQARRRQKWRRPSRRGLRADVRGTAPTEKEQQLSLL